MKLRRDEHLAQYLLTSGELGIAAGQTVIVVLLPVLLERYTRSALLMGFAIGGEGIFALALPFWAGWLSDRLSPHLARRWGRRTLFLLLTAPIMALAIGVAPFLSGFWALAGMGFVFFAAMHAYVTPFMALIVDDVPDSRRARVQGFQGALRAAGLGFGLVVGGLLYSAWGPLPFLTAAGLVLLTTGLTCRADRGAAGRVARSREELPRENLSGWRELLRKPAAIWVLLANSLWNAAIDGIRPYIFLYAGKVLGTTVPSASFGLIFLVGGLALGSIAIGRLSDRFGRTRLLEIGTGIMAIAMLAGFFARTQPVALAVSVAAGIGAAAMMTLPFPVFASIMGQQTAGEYSGLFVVGIGLGRVLAPMLVGGAVDLGRHWLPKQEGYPFMWLVAGAFALAGWLALRQSERVVRRIKASQATAREKTVPRARRVGEP